MRLEEGQRFLAVHPPTMLPLLCLLAISITLKIEPIGLTHIELVYPESDEKQQQQLKDTTNCRLQNMQAKFDEEMLNVNESIQTYTLEIKHLIFLNDELRQELK